MPRVVVLLLPPREKQALAIKPELKIQPFKTPLKQQTNRTELYSDRCASKLPAIPCTPMCLLKMMLIANDA